MVTETGLEFGWKMYSSQQYINEASRVRLYIIMVFTIKLLLLSLCMQLAWYDSILRQDSYMMGATIFLMDGTSDWKAFSINGPTADLLTLYLKSQNKK